MAPVTGGIQRSQTISAVHPGLVKVASEVKTNVRQVPLPTTAMGVVVFEYSPSNGDKMSGPS